MKTYIKSLLAIATVALLGSSAQAADHAISLQVGDTSTQQATYQNKSRWWKLTTSTTATSIQQGQYSSVRFNPCSPNADYISGATSTVARFTFTATAPGTEKWILYTHTDCGETDAGTYPDGTESGSGQTWASTVGETYTITVTEPEYKLVENPVEVTATRITFAEGVTKNAAKYVGYETKAGNQYACGKDDEPKEAFRTSDGSPHVKLADTTQLFVIEAK